MDRSPEYFKLVWWIICVEDVTCCPHIPKDKGTLEALQAEADYLWLQGLVEICQSKFETSGVRNLWSCQAKNHYPVGRFGTTDHSFFFDENTCLGDGKVFCQGLALWNMQRGGPCFDHALHNGAF